MPDSDSNWRELYPFASNFLETAGHRIHYIDEGPRSGDPVLMVHGNPTWSFYWRGLISKLSYERSRTVAIDHMGCGLSDKPSKFDYCLASHRDNLCSLIDHLDLKNVTLMAHDWGGAIGLSTLLKRRERFKRIVLFNTGAFPPPYVPLRIRACRWPLVGQLGVRGLNMFARAAITMATEQRGGLPDRVAAGMIAPYDSWANRIAIYHFVKDIPVTRMHRTWKLLAEVEKQLPSLASMPSMLVWGMKDWCFRPECLERFVKAWPDAEVHRLDDAGHYVVEDAAGEVEDLAAEFVGRAIAESTGE
ncbi:MAG: alpha/beta fold hydrolase [Planctomycetota bacterium]